MDKKRQAATKDGEEGASNKKRPCEPQVKKASQYRTRRQLLSRDK